MMKWEAEQKGYTCNNGDYLQFCLPVKVKKSEFAIDGRENVFVEVIDTAKPLGRGEEHGISVNKTFLTTSAIRFAETKEYQDALKRIWLMSEQERAKIFGLYHTSFSEILDREPSGIIRALEEYGSEPKIGEIWKNKNSGDLVVIKGPGKIDGEPSVSFYWLSSGTYSRKELDDFKMVFSKTEKTSKYISLFLKELEGLKDG